jgi:cysteinyl-tRNA synthetase
MLQVYDSLTKKKQPLKPIDGNNIKMYVCGITVYDFCHLGHARMMVAFDLISRYLRTRGYDIKYVQNITDIDDKIIKRANENGEPYFEFIERFIAAMQEDRAALNIIKPDEEPRATEFIPQIITLIETLITKGYAYVASNGDVYYDVRKFKTYGELAHQNLDEFQSGARVDINEAKHNPLDFVLWKIAKPNEPSWESPWGAGRPGWHIECSAMSTTCLGNHLDIHGGGLDLLFPHHQNEIAQSEAATGEKFVNLWLHNGFVNVDAEKMSKSLNNFTTIREALKEYRPEVLRYFLLASHYRSPINYSSDNLASATGALERLYTALRDLPQATELDTHNYEPRFYEKMDDDFNTPEALAVLFDLAREINRLKSTDYTKAVTLGALLKRLGGILGLLQNDPTHFLQMGGEDEKAEIESLIKQRLDAKANKNWAEADKIRDKLLHEYMVTIGDNGANTTWRKISRID